MAVVKVYSGSYCGAEAVVRKLAGRLGSEVIDDQAVVRRAAALFGDAESKLLRTLAGKVSAFENFTLERTRNVGHLRAALAEVLERDNLIITGAAGQLLPRTIGHLLSVCLIAEINHRYDLAMKEKGVSRREAQKLVARDDEGPKLWCEHLLRKSPWDADLYDILVPMNKTGEDQAVELIAEHAQSDVLKPSPMSRRAVRDFQLGAKVEAALGKEGHNVSVAAADGTVTLTINKHTLMLTSLEDDLKRIARKVPEVKDVVTKVGPGFYQADVYRRFDFEVPSRVLLVDDEKEFVQTLSERLMMRDMGSAVVYDGEQALSFVAEEPPDVIVLDLKMPGIDGIEVLRRLKREHPEIEVIILTGHGTEHDRELCLSLGAFAYLQKPVDIDKLSQTMHQAYQKLRAKKPPDGP